MHFFVSGQTRAVAGQPHWVLAAAAGGILLGVAEPELRLGLLLGMGLFVLLWRSRYRDGFLWFAAFPGLLHLLSPPWLPGKRPGPTGSKPLFCCGYLA